MGCFMIFFFKISVWLDSGAQALGRVLPLPRAGACLGRGAETGILVLPLILSRLGLAGAY